MKRTVFCFILLASIILSACSPSVNVDATKTSEAFAAKLQSLVKTQEATLAVKPTSTPPPPPPTETPVPAAPVDPSAPTAPTAPPAAPVQTVDPAALANPTGPAILDEKFDKLSEDWQTLWVSNRLEKVSKSEVKIDPQNPGFLLFDFKDKGAVSYEFNKKLVESDVIIDTVNQIGGPGQTEVAVACRANNELTSWIDFRILYMNEFAIYKYDKTKLDTGDNPFIQLVRAKLPEGLLKLGEYNKIRAICKGKTASLILNDSPLGSADVDVTAPGMVGVGGFGPSSGNTAVWFDFVKVTKP